MDPGKAIRQHLPLLHIIRQGLSNPLGERISGLLPSGSG